MVWRRRQGNAGKYPSDSGDAVHRDSGLRRACGRGLEPREHRQAEKAG